MVALTSFFNHTRAPRARVDRYCCLISAALADRHFIFVLSAALAEPFGAGNFWPTIVLAAELATAAELPGRADRRPALDSRHGRVDLFLQPYAGAPRARRSILLFGISSAGRPTFHFCFISRVGRAVRRREFLADDRAGGGARHRRRATGPSRSPPGLSIRGMVALTSFFNHTRAPRARVDRYCCLISAALADRHFIFVLSAALAEPFGAGVLADDRAGGGARHRRRATGPSRSPPGLSIRGMVALTSFFNHTRAPRARRSILLFDISSAGRPTFHFCFISRVGRAVRRRE